MSLFFFQMQFITRTNKPAQILMLYQTHIKRYLYMFCLVFTQNIDDKIS